MAPNSQSPFDQAEKKTATRRHILKVGTGAVATAGSVPLLSGLAAAHFPNQLDIDVKSDCNKNTLNANSNGVIPVTVMPTEFTDEDGQTVQFDPTEEDVRYRFGTPDVVDDNGGARPAHDEHHHAEDGDNATVLMLHFPMEETAFDSGVTEAKLVWERDESGEHGYSGTDEVTFMNP